MKGGGSWDEYCPFCAFPYGFGYNSDDTYLSDERRDLTAEEINIVNEKAERFESVAVWMSSSIGIDKVNNLIFNLTVGGNEGDIRMNKIQPSKEALNLMKKRSIFTSGEAAFNYDDDERKGRPSGWAVHKDCATIIENAIGRKLKPSDEDIITKHAVPSKRCSKWSDQFYDYPTMILREDVSFVESPLVSDQQRKRILKCSMNFIDAVTVKQKARNLLALRNTLGRNTMNPENATKYVPPVLSHNLVGHIGSFESGNQTNSGVGYPLNWQLTKLKNKASMLFKKTRKARKSRKARR